MKHNKSPITLARPVLGTDVNRAIDSYVPVLLNDAQQATGLLRVRQIVRACGPKSVVEARTLLSTASRYLADVSSAAVLDPDRWIQDDAVAEWAHAQLRAGMLTQVLSNHLLILRRMLRVRAGLPARMPRHTASRMKRVPIGEQDRLQLELAMTAHEASALTYIAAIGANLVATNGVGWTVWLDGKNGAWMIKGAERCPIVDALISFATFYAGGVVPDGGWLELRDLSTKFEIDLDRSSSLVTFALLALQEQRSGVEVLNRHRLSRRTIQDVRPHLASVDPARSASLLRGV